MSLYATLCPVGAYAQDTVETRHATSVLSIDEIFALADQNSKSLRHHSTGINAAHEAVNVAKKQVIFVIRINYVPLQRSRQGRFRRGYRRGDNRLKKERQP
jgi:hypothetical protein